MGRAGPTTDRTRWSNRATHHAPSPDAIVLHNGHHSASVQSFPVSIHVRLNTSGALRPDAPPRPVTRLRLCAHTEHRPDASGHSETTSSPASGHPSDLHSPLFLHLQRSGKIGVSLPQKRRIRLHLLYKCANTNKYSPPCARMLAFSQSFSQRR
jgi:hypothetical protein